MNTFAPSKGLIFPVFFVLLFFTFSYIQAQSPGNVSTSLELWLKADAGVTGTSPVTAWADQSGNTLNATAVNSPALVSDGLNFNPTITFDGTSARFTTAAVQLASTTSSPISLIVVFDTDNNSGQKFLLMQNQTNCSNNIELGYDTGNGTGVGNFGLHTGCSNATIAAANTISGNTFNIMSTQILSSGTTPANINIFRNGQSLSVANDVSGFPSAGSYGTTSAILHIGARNGGTPDAFHDGDIAEMIVYSQQLSTTDRQKIESYLAVKYGITIDQTSATNYLASDGGTVWDGTTNASYNTDIAGIGRDDNSALDQQKTKSINSNAILTIANGDITTPTSFSADDSWLIWGSDNGATTFGSGNINNADGTTSNRMTRVWKVEETGTVGNLEISFSNSLATGTVSIVIDPADNTFANNAERRIIEMVDSGSDYEVTVDFVDGEFFSFVNASASAISTKPVLINEVVPTPQQDFSSGGFFDASPGGSAGTDDEWVELYMATDGVDLTSWTIELNDGTDVTGDLTSTGAFDVSNYMSTAGGSFTSTKTGDYLILGNVDGSGEINATGTVTINLKNSSSAIIDQVVISASSGTGFNGSSTGTTDESISRIPNGTDTNVNSTDFSKTKSTLGTTNSPSGTVKINEVVTDPQQDWGSISFSGSPPGGTGAANDEWIELYIGTAGINLTGWTIELTDGSDQSGELTTTGNGIFGTVNYVTSGSGSFINTEVGDYVVLGDPTGDMNNDVLVILKDASGTEIDRVQLGGAASQAPSGNATGTSDESIVRYTNATDTDTDDTDFIQTISSLGATNSLSGTVVINEVVTDPQQDWSTNGFDGTVAGGTVSDVDEWVELYIGTAGINLTNWTIELTDGSNVTGNLTSTGAFDVSNYISSGSGSFLSTSVGDYLILGNVDGGGAMSNDILITLKDATGATIDVVELGDDPASDGAGDGAPDGTATGGDATSASDESVSRIPNASDTGNDITDFSATAASLGTSNAVASLPSIGNGLDFDGTNDYIDLGSQIVSSSTFTLEAWVNASSFTNSGRFNRIVAIDYGSYTADNPFVIFVNSSGQIGYVLGTGNAVNDQQVPLSFSPTLSTSTWYHVVLTFDGSTKNLYVDGILEGSVSNTGTFTNTNSEQLLIGDFATADSDNGEWEGQIDELRIWDDVRTHEEVLENMFTTLTGSEANLTAYYKFDQSSGTSLPDITSNNNDGTLTNMAGSEWTAAGWNTYSQNAAIFQSGGSDTSTGTSGELTLTDVAFLNDDNDILIAGHENSDFSEVTTDLPSGTLITARYDRNWHITKNDASGTSNGNVTFSFDLGSTPSSDNTYYLLERTGTSGDFAIVPVIGINPSGTSIVFTVNTSQIDDGSYYTVGRSDADVGNSLDFDGTNDYVSIGSPPLTATDNITLEAWVYPDGFSGTTYAIYNGTIATDGYGISFDASGNIGITTGNDGTPVVSSTALATSTWAHIAAVRNAGTWELYVNGVEVTISFTQLPDTPTAAAAIGGDDLGAQLFNGQLDEVRLWSEARTQAQLTANMFSNLAGDESNLAGYYRMNQGIGNNDSNLPDLSGDNNNGTLTNFDNLNAATASSNYVTSARTVFSNSALIVNGGTLSATSGELTITSTQTAGDFLQDSGDQIIWGNDGGAFTETTSDVPSTTLVTNRITKTWNIDKNDVSGTANGNVTFSFDLGTTPTKDYTYYLLSRTGTSGDFSVVEVVDSNPNSNSIEFRVDGAQITDGNYFTLGRSDSGAGNAIDLDGTDDYIDLGDLALTTGTIEMWIYADDLNNNRRIISQLTGATSQQGPLGINPAGTGNAYSIYVWPGSTAWLELVNVGSDWSGSWHHLAVVYSGGSATAYWDGVQQMTQTTNFDFNGVSMGVGAQYTGGNGITFNGKIDELRVWSDARTTAEIVDNMNANLEGVEANLIRYYRCNEGIASGTNTGVDLLPNRSGNGNSASTINLALSGSSSNWLTSNALVVDESSSHSLVGPGNALDFDGTNDHVLISDNATLESSSLLTVEAWLRPTSVAGSQAAVSRYFTGGDASNAYLIDMTTTTLRFFINESDNNLVSASSTIAANVWTHVAGVADGSNVHIYVNGILEASTAYDGTITSNSTRDLIIGKFRTEDNFGPFVGQIDEVRIWNIARTATEIQDNMFEELTGSETGLVAYYQFDEVAGSTSLPDNSSNSNTGTLTNMDAANDWVDASAREPFKTTGAGNWNTSGTWKSGSVPNASSADLNVGHDLTLDANISVGDLNINSGVTLTLNASQTLTISGNLVNNGTITGSGAISFAGSGAQCLTAGTYSNITLNNTADEITLDGNATFTGTLTLTNGNLVLGSNSVTINSGGSISGGSSSSYVQTLNQNSSGGSLQMEVANGAGTVTFPIGTSTYTPFSMINLGTTGDFNIRVFDDTYTDGTSGTSLTTTEEINKTWDINALGSGFNTTITIQWNSLTDEDASFTRNSMFLSKNDSDGIWTKITGTISATDLGSNTYSASASGVSSFSQVAGGSGGSLLPVSLVFFKVTLDGNNVHLSWQTASEINNDRFEIERSGNGSYYNKIGEIQGVGNSTDLVDYSFKDNNPLDGISYYRLKQVDFDGEFEYSNVEMVMLNSGTNRINIYPNPSDQGFTIELAKALKGASTIELMDLSGKAIFIMNLTGDHQKIELPTSQTPPGIYFLKITNGFDFYLKKIIRK